MLDVVTIAGSPSASSRCAAILDRARDRLAARGVRAAGFSVRDLHPEELVWGQIGGPSIQNGLGLIEQARGVVVATPVYKAAYSGVLKAFLDLLPPDVLAGKVVLPIATAGSLAHCLALEYALKPVLSALGARHVLGGFCVLDSDVTYDAGRPVGLEEAAADRLDRSLDDIVSVVRPGREALVLEEIAV